LIFYSYDEKCSNTITFHNNVFLFTIKGVSFMSGFLSALPGAVAQGIIYGIMAIGVFITFRVLDIADLTVDGTLTTGGAVIVLCMTNGLNVWVSMLIAFLAGCIAGLITGIFHTKFGIPAILAGILTQLALYSINLRILSGKANLPLNARIYNILFSLGEIKKSLILAVVFVIVLIAILYWFFGTELGHGIRATGCNEAMSRSNGINTNTNKVIGLVLSNGIVALAGAMLAQYQGYADVNMGRGAIVIGLAAVIIGEVLLGKIFKNFALKLLAVAFGGIIYYVAITLVLRLGLNPNDLKLLTSVVVALFLGIPFWKNNIKAKTVKNKEVKA
jgi:putative ABC transport system permease protein